MPPAPAPWDPSQLCLGLNRFPLQLLVKNIQLEDGKMLPAAHFFKGAASSALELTEEELATAEAVRVRGSFGAAVQRGGLGTVRVFCVNPTGVVECPDVPGPLSPWHLGPCDEICLE